MKIIFYTLLVFNCVCIFGMENNPYFKSEEYDLYRSFFVGGQVPQCLNNILLPSSLQGSEILKNFDSNDNAICIKVISSLDRIDEEFQKLSYKQDLTMRKWPIIELQKHIEKNGMPAQNSDQWYKLQKTIVLVNFNKAYLFIKLAKLLNNK